MPLLSDRQLADVSRIIEDNHTAFLIQIGLGDQVPPEQVQRLVRLGLVSKAQVKAGLLDDAFLFGLLADSLEESKAKHMEYEQFQQWAARHEVPLGQEEREAVKSLKRSMATHLKRLRSQVEDDTQETLVEADQLLHQRMAATVTHKLTQGVEQRKSVAEVASALKKATGQYARDWTRVAVTELNNAFQEGKLATIQKSNKGRDPDVFKRVKKSACKECKEAYLTKSGAPRVFKLSQLLANGSNIGRHRHDRRATIKSHHPHCCCELQELPPGFEFDSQGRMRYVGLGT
jgi:hypothetical protein